LGQEYWLENLLLRMTAVDRNDRIATVAEALELMQEALAETRPALASFARPEWRVPPLAASADCGLMYADGRRVAQDDAQAVARYRQAAEKGDPEAMTKLGTMYRDGRGVAQDDAQAVAWYRKVAEAGDPWGTRNLGVMYEVGQGVLKDVAEALAWYRKAAALEDENAKADLRRLGQ
jgi:TPR repeat protein